MNEIKTGDVVMWAEPLNEAEKGERWIVVNDYNLPNDSCDRCEVCRIHQSGATRRNEFQVYYKKGFAIVRKSSAIYDKEKATALNELCGLRAIADNLPKWNGRIQGNNISFDLCANAWISCLDGVSIFILINGRPWELKTHRPIPKTAKELREIMQGYLNELNPMRVGGALSFRGNWQGLLD